MSRYREAVCKLCRNEGVKLFLKGDRCDTPKCAIERRNYGSGQHGQARRKLSEYAIQLREKQKVRRLFSLSEKQFRRLYKDASRRKGVTGTILLQSLESRLDNLVYRSGLVPSRPQARQMICHGHFLVNGKKVDIPSCQVKVGDKISVRDGSKALIKGLMEGRKPMIPHWLDVSNDTLEITYTGVPAREDLDPTIKEQLIIEYYSR